MNHEPSQFCGPPTWEGATLDVPLPQSATLSDMCVNGPIVYECLDSVLRSQVHLLQRKKRPQQGTILSPWWAGPGVRLRVSHVRENGRMSCVCLAACVTGSMRDWVRTHAETEEKNNKSNNIWRETKIEKRNNEVSKGFRKEILPLKERLILKSLKGRTLDMEKKKSSSWQGFFFLFWIIVNLVLIDTGQCYWQVWSSSALY